MFTGLIEAVGKVTGIERHGAAARLTVEAPFPPAEIQMGDSIAVNGVCLTVVGKGGGTFTFDVSPETIDRTAFRRLKSGSRVNLERALRLSDRLGGHIVRELALARIRPPGRLGLGLAHLGVGRQPLFDGARRACGLHDNVRAFDFRLLQSYDLFHIFPYDGREFGIRIVNHGDDLVELGLHASDLG